MTMDLQSRNPARLKWIGFNRAIFRSQGRTLFGLRSLAESHRKLRQLKDELADKERENRQLKAELEAANADVEQLCMKLARAIYDNSQKR